MRLPRTRGWMWHGKYWKVDLLLDYWLSFGLHLDFKARRTGRGGIRYAPYVDLHLGVLTLSLGLRPHLSGEYDLLWGGSRGGEDARRI